MLTTKEIADRLDTDPRTLRRFLRSTEQGVGTGKRYEFDSKQVAALKKKFATWREAVESDRTAKVEAKELDEHTCEECGKSFKSARSLAGHKASHA